MNSYKKIKQKDKIIFLFPYAPTAWEEKKFGFNSFLKKNISLLVYDLSALVSTRAANPARPLNKNYIKKIKSYRQFENELISLNNTAIFIDLINGLKGFGWGGKKIFSLFKRYQTEYYVIEVGSLPVLAERPRRSLFRQIKKAFQLRKLFYYLKWRAGRQVVYLQWRYFKSYQLPTKIFSTSSEGLQCYLKKYPLSFEKVIAIHSFDYDRYLQSLTEADSKTPILTGKYCVFLDQMLATHCDFGKTISHSPVTAEKYFPSLNRFFDQIENELGMPVVIAASQRAHYDGHANIFGQRKILSGETVNLVANSALVLMHSSTAVSFAVLYDKPILILKTQEMEAAWGYTNFLYQMAHALGVQPLCIEDRAAINECKLAEYESWPRNYDNYKFKYIMSKNAENKITWDVVIEYFLQN